MVRRSRPSRPDVGFAIVGAGFIGTVHAHAGRAAGGRLIGVAGSSAASAREAADRLGADRAYEDLEQLVADPAVQIVHVCAPNDVHVPAAEAAIAAGKHVICEKPLAPDLAGARRLLEAAGSAGVVGAVPFVYRYYPMLREARARQRAGALGRLGVAHGSYLQDWLLGAERTNWRVDTARGGASRAFADIGSHWCDLFEFVADERIAAVSAELHIVHSERQDHETAGRTFDAADDGAQDRMPVETEDVALVHLRTESGAVGSLVVSQVAAGYANDFVLSLDGLEGSLTFAHRSPDELRIGTVERTELLRRDGARLSPAAARFAVLPAGHPQGYLDCFEAFVRDVHAAVGGALPDGLPQFADGVRAAAIVEAALASARAEGRWVAVGSASVAAAQNHA